MSYDPLTFTTRLGFITLQWSVLDWLLTGAIGWLTSLEPKHTLILMDRVNVSRKLDIIRTLIHTDHPELDEEFSTIAGKVREAISIRNRMMHGAGFPAQEGAALIVAQTYGKLAAREESVTAESLEETLINITNATNSILQFLKKHGLSPSPCKSNESNAGTTE